MLPDFRQLVAMTCLALSVLIFAFGAAALLRTAHDDFAALQSQRAGREPGRAQFVLNHGAYNPGAAPRDVEASSEPSLAALQLPDASIPARASETATLPVQDKPAENKSVQATAPLPDSRSTLTITDRAAAPVESAQMPNLAAATIATTPDHAKDQIALNVAPSSQSSDKIADTANADTAKGNASGSDDLKPETRVQDSAKPPSSSTETTISDSGAQTKIAALDPAASTRAVAENPARRASIRRAKKPATRAAQIRKRNLAARQRAAATQAARPAPQQAASAAAPSGNLFIQGGN